jgi:hypothetical protein
MSYRDVSSPYQTAPQPAYAAPFPNSRFRPTRWSEPPVDQRDDTSGDHADDLQTTARLWKQSISRHSDQRSRGKNATRL